MFPVIRPGHAASRPCSKKEENPTTLLSRRGYVPEDEKQFTGKRLELLQKAADEVQFLLDRGYDVKPVTTFVGIIRFWNPRNLFSLPMQQQFLSEKNLLYLSLMFLWEIHILLSTESFLLNICRPSIFAGQGIVGKG